MAGTTVLEREYELRDENRGEVSPAEEEHAKHISDNYQRIIRGESDVTKQSVADALFASVRAETRERTVSAPTAGANNTAQRIADNLAIAAELRGKQRAGESPAYSSARVVDYAPVTESAAPAPAPAPAPLFEGLRYQDGELLNMNAPAYEPSYAPAYTPEETPAYEPVYAPQYDPSFIPSEEDSIPTRETMATILRSQQAEKSGFFAALNMKTKVVLAAVATAIIVLIAIVCINTAVLNSLSADIETGRAAVTELTRQAEGIQAEIGAVEDPANIGEWALQHGMTHVVE